MRLKEVGDYVAWFGLIATVGTSTDEMKVDDLVAKYEQSKAKPHLLRNVDRGASVERTAGTVLNKLEEMKLMTGEERSFFVRHMEVATGDRAVRLTPFGSWFARRPAWIVAAYFQTLALFDLASGAFGKIKGPLGVAGAAFTASRLIGKTDDLVAAGIGMGAGFVVLVSNAIKES